MVEIISIIFHCRERTELRRGKGGRRRRKKNNNKINYKKIKRNDLSSPMNSLVY
ncbi:hypothetical protein Nmel_009477 [Mimus melanotis]